VRFLQQIGLALSVAAGFAVASPATAATVQVNVVFSSFTGAVGSSAQFETYIDSGLGPVLVCPDAGCGSGIGTRTAFPLTGGDNAIEFWNTDFGVERTRNFIGFVAAPAQSVVFGQTFLLGTITFSNGTWFTDPEFEISFVTSSFDDPAYNGFRWDDVLHLGITTNSAANSPAQNADFIYFTLHPGLGSARAYELSDSPTGSNTVSFDVYGQINSLTPTQFANATGGGFLDPSVSPQPTVPEPSVLGLLLAGTCGLAWMGRRRMS
jgi:hypothetical protein